MLRVGKRLTKHKGNVSHAPIGQLLLPLNAMLVESLTCSVNVVDRDANVAKALRLIVAVVVLEVLLVFGAMVMSQFEQPFDLRLRTRIALARLWYSGTVAQKVQRKASARVVRGALERHAHDILIESQRPFGILDADHGVIHPRGIDIGAMLILGLLDWSLRNDLYPVAIGIERKCNRLHTAVGQLLLEFVTSIFETLAGSLDIIDRNTDMTETLVWFGIAIGVSLFGRLVIVSQFNYSLTIRPRRLVRDCAWTVIGEKVQIEFGIWLFNLVDLLHA